MEAYNVFCLFAPYFSSFQIIRLIFEIIEN
jgi:hypothetical protein